LKSCCVLRDDYDDEHYKIVFHKTTPELQDQDQDEDRIYWSQTGLVLRPTVSHHITGQKKRPPPTLISVFFLPPTTLAVVALQGVSKKVS